MHSLLQESNGNVSAVDIREWNISDAMHSVIVLWESLVPAVI